MHFFEGGTKIVPASNYIYACIFYDALKLLPLANDFYCSCTRIGILYKLSKIVHFLSLQEAEMNDLNENHSNSSLV